MVQKSTQKLEDIKKKLFSGSNFIFSVNAALGQDNLALGSFYLRRHLLPDVFCSSKNAFF